MATPREQHAARYLREHRIPALLHALTGELLFHRPERPREFLVSKLEMLKSTHTHPCLFSDSNLDAVFGILDTTKQGYISLAQYKEALNTLGVKDFDESPEGAEFNKISLDTFKKEAKSGLLSFPAAPKV
ncbi:EFC10 protein, partial [Amia calva]|nr:EFC10 protein [Amia calva]